MSVQPVLTLNNLTKNYSGLTSAGVNNISFSVFSGEIISVVGESGSGKSTLLKLIYGLLTPDAGTVVFKDKVVRGPEQKLIPGHEQMKMVTQDFSLNIYAKVYENIASLLPNTNLKYKQEKTWEMMEFLRIDHLADKRAVDLSGGEQQRVAIAKAIITNPEILLLDEPFSQVDPLLKTDLRADIKRLSRDLGITIILVSHDPVDGLSLADRLVILRKGDIQEIGAPRDLYENPAKAYTIQLLSNCSVLSKEEAEVLGIETLKEKVAIHAEWVAIDEGSDLIFKVKDIIYKGFYEELILRRDAVIIKALNLAVGTFPVGAAVPISIRKFIQFDE